MRHHQTPKRKVIELTVAFKVSHSDIFSGVCWEHCDTLFGAKGDTLSVSPPCSKSECAAVFKSC